MMKMLGDLQVDGENLRFSLFHLCEIKVLVIVAIVSNCN